MDEAGWSSKRQLIPKPSNTSGKSGQNALAQHARVKRKNTSTACDSCRQKRIKCNGGSVPCVNCTKLDIPCHIDATSDQRRRAVTMTKLEQLENDQRLLRALLTKLNDIPYTSPDRWATYVRYDASSQMSKPGLEKSKSKSSESGPETPAHTVSLPEKLPSQSKSVCVRRVTDAAAQESIFDGQGQVTQELETKDILQPHKNASAIQSCSRRKFRDDDDDTDETSEREKEFNAMEMFMALGTNHFPSSSTIAPVLPLNQYHGTLPIRNNTLIQGPVEACLPLNIRTNPDDPAHAAVQSVLSFQAAARSQITQVDTIRSILCMDSFDLCLFYRDRTPRDGHTVANWACEWGKAWMGYPLPMRLATVYFIGAYMRWLIMPCKETYEMMSPLVRPLPCQLLIPHTMDIDLWSVPPAMRAVQLLYGGGWLLRATSKTQRLNWQQESDQCTVETKVPCSATSPDALMDEKGIPYKVVQRFSPEFVSFIEKEENWSVSRDLLSEMPELQGHVQFHESD